MSEQPKRVPLGEAASSKPPQKRQISLLRAMIMLVGGGVITLLAIYLLLGSFDILFFINPDVTSQQTIETAKWAAASFGASMFLVALLLSPAIPLDTVEKSNRLFSLISLFILVGVAVSAAVYLIMAMIMPQGSFSEQIVLPALIMALAGILAVFSPVMPIWPVNVPDSEVWAILDSGGHLDRYVDRGVHIIRPVEGYTRYNEAGAIIININDENVLSRDAFPFRVRVYVLCTFNPMNADDSMRVSLRNMSRAALESGLRTQIEYAIRRRLAETSREQIRLDQILNAIVHDIDSAIKSRAAFGIRRVTDIEITLDPPKVLQNAREGRLILEGLGTTDQRYLNSSLNNLLRLAGESGVNLNINEQGLLSFTLSPNQDIEIGQNLEQAITKLTDLLTAMVNQRTADSRLLPQQEAKAVRGLPDGAAQPSTTRNVTEKESQTDSAAETTQPMTPTDVQAESTEPPTETETPATDNNYMPKNPIDLVEDSQGVYVPRHPLGPEGPPES